MTPATTMPDRRVGDELDGSVVTKVVSEASTLERRAAIREKVLSRLAARYVNGSSTAEFVTWSELRRFVGGKVAAAELHAVLDDLLNAGEVVELRLYGYGRRDGRRVILGLKEWGGRKLRHDIIARVTGRPDALGKIGC